MKTEINIKWKVIKNILIVVKLLSSKWIGFIANLLIFIIPIAYKINFSINNNTIVFFISSLIVYPIVYELIYRYFLKKQLVELHTIIDDVIYSINCNFKGE